MGICSTRRREGGMGRCICLIMGGRRGSGRQLRQCCMRSVVSSDSVRWSFVSLASFLRGGVLM
jgi:hypothetical protein